MKNTRQRRTEMTGGIIHHNETEIMTVITPPAAQPGLMKQERLGMMKQESDNGNLKLLEAAKPRPKTSMVHKVHESRTVAK